MQWMVAVYDKLLGKIYTNSHKILWSQVIHVRNAPGFQRFPVKVNRY